MFWGKAVLIRSLGQPNGTSPSRTLPTAVPEGKQPLDDLSLAIKCTGLGCLPVGPELIVQNWN